MGILTLFVAYGGVAFAAGNACPSSPVNFDGEDCVVTVCDPDTWTCPNVTVCTFLSSSATWRCDLSEADFGSDIWLVEDYDEASPDEDTYEAWGVFRHYAIVGGSLVTTSSNFCCQIDDPEGQIHIIEANGSAGGDKINFQYEEDSTWYNLQNVPAETGSLDAYAYGNGGNDTITGSDAGGLIGGGVYDEELEGGADNDNIQGKGGEEIVRGDDGDDSLFANADGAELYGGAGNDTLVGGTGGDTLEGGDGSDTMRGGDGDDIMNGDNGIDYMSGGDGNDEMDGGEGGDVMCGGAGAEDHLDDGDLVEESIGTDRLWDESATDELICASGKATRWGNSSVTEGTGCDPSDQITTKPAGCP